MKKIKYFKENVNSTTLIITVYSARQTHPNWKEKKKKKSPYSYNITK